MKESMLQKACLGYLQSLENKGFPVISTRTNAGKIKKGAYWLQLCRKGWPDITTCIKGQFYGFEIKANHKQTKEQIQMEQKFKNAGAIYALFDNISDFRAYIDRIF